MKMIYNLYFPRIFTTPKLMTLLFLSASRMRTNNCKLQQHTIVNNLTISIKNAVSKQRAPSILKLKYYKIKRRE